MFETVWVEDPTAFAALAGEWEELASDEPSAFASHGWLSAWWGAFGGGTRMRVCTIRDAGRLVAALPLRYGARGKLETWSSIDVDAVVPLAASDAAADALVDAIVGARWGVLSLRGLPGGAPITAQLRTRLDAVARTLVDKYDDSPTIDTTGTLEDYRRAMSKNTRQRVGKHRRKLEREHDVQVTTLERHDGDIEEALALEHAGWKGQGGSSVLADARRAQLHRTLARDPAFRMSELRVDGRLAAFDTALVRHGRVFSLVTSYDEGLGGFSPGLVLRMAIVEACFEQGLVANELLGTFLDWKEKFATSTAPTERIRAYRARPAPLARYVARAVVLPRTRTLITRWRAGRARAGAAG